MPDLHGVWTQCGTIHHADNCWCYLDERLAHTVGNICLYWWCVCGREYCACCTCEGASLQLQPPQQGVREVTGWCVSVGLQVWGEDNSLYWRRENKIPDMPCVVTRRNIFSLCGKLVGYLPIGGWLHVAVAFIKRRASDVTGGWDDKIDDASLNTMIKEVLPKVHKEDPAWDRWCVNGQALSIWVDASFLATGMSLVEDGCLLCPEKDFLHINLHIKLGNRLEDDHLAFVHWFYLCP